MKIATTGLNIAAGKVKYDDPIMTELTNQFKPKKVSPYYCEFLTDDYDGAEIIVIKRDQILDLLIMDIEKLEARRERSEDAVEQALIDKVLAQLEDEVPVCDQDFTEAESDLIRNLAPLSLKPTLLLDEDDIEITSLVPLAMEKAQLMFFYTAGQQEVHAWLVPCGTDAQSCAGKIHSDLERGFIRAEVVSVEDLQKCHNMKDALRQGYTKLVERDFIVPSESVIEIRFNV